MDESLARLKAFIAKTYYRDASREIGEDERLISTGVIDSMGLVDLVLFLEDEFRVRVDASDLGVNGADTVAEIHELVLSRTR